MPTLPRTRGHHNAAGLLLVGIQNLDQLLRLDEFPEHRADLERIRNQLRALKEIRDEDSARGRHHGDEDELPPFPPRLGLTDWS